MIIKRAPLLKTYLGNRMMPWLITCFSAAIIALCALPLFALIYKASSTETETFTFLARYVLPETIKNSIILTLGVGLTAFIIGTGTAWLIARYHFPAKRAFEWLLILPLAFPAYIMAYAYTDFLDVAGPLQTSLRAQPWLNVHIKSLPNIRSMGGAIIILSLCLYPYIYLLARTAFIRQTQNQMDAATMLGAPPWRVFISIALPSARPYIFVGLALVIMETLADYGTVSFFGLRVFSTSIYNAWAGYGDLSAATKLSFLLLVPVMALFIFEKYNRGKMRFFNLDSDSATKKTDLPLRLPQQIAAIMCCALPVIIGFALPFLILCAQAIDVLIEKNSIAMLTLTLKPLAHSLSLSAAAAIFGMAVALLLMALRARTTSAQHKAALTYTTTYGYAMPGIMIGLSFLVIAGWWRTLGGGLITGSMIFIILAYTIRFITVPVQSLQAAMEKISPNIHHAGTMLAQSGWSNFWHIKLPLLTPALLSSFLVLLIDIMKELPITLILRPFNFDTLAIKAYNLAMDERLSEAALPSLVIVTAGLLPVILLSRLIRQSRS